MECNTFWGLPLIQKQAYMDSVFREACQHVGLTSCRSPPLFYSHSNHVTTTCGGVTYKDLWKGGNNFFQFNIEKKCRSTVSHSRPKNGGRTFTFVREPLSHFVSGYREAVWRNCVEEEKKQREECSLLYRNGTEIAKRAIYTVLRGSFWPWFVHLSLMGSYVFEGAVVPSYIGKLETVERDYDSICRKMNCPPEIGKYSLLDKTLGHHRTSEDEQGLSKKMLSLLATEKGYMKAVTRILALDYSCFNYTYSG